MASRNADKDKRNFNNAIKEARIGHRESKYEVGLMYANGVGVAQDFVQAIHWIRQAAEKGLTEKVHILAGVTPLKSARMAKYMATKVSGIKIPDSIIKRLEGVPKEKAAAEKS